MNHSASYRSLRKSTRFPGVAIAAPELGVDRVHLFKVLKGERQSISLLKRWDAWLQANPEFLKANQEKAAKTNQTQP